MLSYRHAYHAGNHADVLKHWVQSLILQALCQKEKPFFYMDTHAGGGLYRLDGERANKTAEYREGIARVLNQNLGTSLTAYQTLIRDLNPKTLSLYPGSPYIASKMMRNQDKALLCELHPRDYQSLNSIFTQDKRIRLLKEDAYQQIKAALPPPIKRGLVLIDPSYEIKTDYQKVSEAVEQGLKRFATGIYAVWYPVVDRRRVDQLLKGFKQRGISLLQVELCVQGDRHEMGMTGSGMLVVNPPWKLEEQIRADLPALQDALAQDEQAFHTLRYWE